MPEARLPVGPAAGARDGGRLREPGKLLPALRVPLSRDAELREARGHGEAVHGRLGPAPRQRRALAGRRPLRQLHLRGRSGLLPRVHVRELPESPAPGAGRVLPPVPRAAASLQAPDRLRARVRAARLREGREGMRAVPLQVAQAVAERGGQAERGGRVRGQGLRGGDLPAAGLRAELRARAARRRTWLRALPVQAARRLPGQARLPEELPPGLQDEQARMPDLPLPGQLPRRGQRDAARGHDLEQYALQELPLRARRPDSLQRDRLLGRLQRPTAASSGTLLSHLPDLDPGRLEGLGPRADRPHRPAGPPLRPADGAPGAEPLPRPTRALGGELRRLSTPVLQVRAGLRDARAGAPARREDSAALRGPGGSRDARARGCSRRLIPDYIHLVNGHRVGFAANVCARRLLSVCLYVCMCVCVCVCVSCVRAEF